MPVKVVVNPYGRIPETNLLNNSKSMSVAVAPIQANQTITFGALADRLLGAPPFALSATASSGLAVSFASLTPTVCTVSGGTVTLVATGICTIQATQPGSAFFYAAAPKTQSFAVRSTTKTNQTITFAAPPERTLGDPAFALNATASSGLPVSYATQTPSVCTVAGNLVTLAAAGVCSIQALQNGNATYNPATPITRSFTVLAARASQTITFAQPADKTFGAVPFALSGTASSGLPVSFASLTQGVCTVSGSTVTLVAVGTCTIRATQAGNASFDAAPAVERSFAVAEPPVVKQGQTITFAALADRTLGDAPFALSATASSGLPVSFASLTSGRLHGERQHGHAGGGGHLHNHGCASGQQRVQPGVGRDPQLLGAAKRRRGDG